MHRRPLLERDGTYSVPRSLDGKRVRKRRDGTEVEEGDRGREKEGRLEGRRSWPNGGKCEEGLCSSKNSFKIAGPGPGTWTIRTLDCSYRGQSRVRKVQGRYEQSMVRIVREHWTLANFVTDRRPWLAQAQHVTV